MSEARARTLNLIADLSDEQMIGPRLAIVNPLRWEIAHVAWFQEYWLLRRLRQQNPALSHGDSLYDSARVAHDTRWELPLPPKAETIGYMQLILDRVLEQSQSGEVGEVNGYDETYFLQLALFHEDMHAEAITYTRQTLNYPIPHITAAQDNPGMAKQIESGDPTYSASLPNVKLGDAIIPGGSFLLGSAQGLSFVFDNEM